MPDLRVLLSLYYTWEQCETAKKHMIFEKYHSIRSEKSCVTNALRSFSDAQDGNNVTFSVILDGVFVAILYMKNK